MRWLTGRRVALFLILGAGSAFGQSELAVVPDATQILINKDVSGLRWAIAYDPEEGVVTGNVYSLDGGPAQFLWCLQEGREGGRITFDCQGTDECSDWEALGTVVIDESFFDPDRGAAPSDPEAIPEGATAGGSGARSTARYAPDASTLLISKDVAGARWAISRSSDGRVFGNVFPVDGGPPTFLVCSSVGESEEGSVLDCSATGSDGWEPLDETRLPSGFFAPRCSPTRMPAANENLCASFPPPLLPPRLYDPVGDPPEGAFELFGAQFLIEEQDLGEQWNGYDVIREVTTVSVFQIRTEVLIGCQSDLGAVLLGSYLTGLDEPVAWEPPLPRCQDYAMAVGSRCEWVGRAPFPNIFEGERSLQASARITREVVGYEDVDVPAGTFENAMVLRDVTAVRTPILSLEESDFGPVVTPEGYEFVPVVTRTWIDKDLGVVRTRCESAAELCGLVPGIDLVRAEGDAS